MQLVSALYAKTTTVLLFCSSAPIDPLESALPSFLPALDYCQSVVLKRHFFYRLLRFFVLKLHHRDYNTGDDDKFEDTIVPFNNHLDSIWVLFLSHYDEYSSFIKRISAHILNGEEIVLKRNYSTLRQSMPIKRHISRINYKNRYGSLPDIELNTGIIKRIESCDGYDYWQGTYYNNGLCKHGILVYSLNNPDDFHYFIGTLADNEDNDIESGTLFFTDGRTQDFREGVMQNDPYHPSDNQTDSHEEDDSSVATIIE